MEARDGNEMKKSDMLPGLTAEQWGRPLQPLCTVDVFLTAVSAGAYFLTGATAETVPPWLYIIVVTCRGYLGQRALLK